MRQGAEQRPRGLGRQPPQSAPRRVKGTEAGMPDVPSGLGGRGTGRKSSPKNRKLAPPCARPLGRLGPDRHLLSPALVLRTNPNPQLGCSLRRARILLEAPAAARTILCPSVASVWILNAVCPRPLTAWGARQLSTHSWLFQNSKCLSEAEPKRVLCYPRRVSASPCSTVMWIFRCTMRAELRLKAFPQSLHRYGFSPVWTLWCSRREELCAKAFGHTLH